jgi:ASC-1-like (ASCH) protein
VHWPGLITVSVSTGRRSLKEGHALIFNHDGLQVAVVKDGKSKIRKVRVNRDLGTWVEVDTGIDAGDQVILNPPINLVDGSEVRLAAQ